MEKITNKVFGNLVYDYGWRKDENISFWNENKKVEINIIAYTNEPVTHIQEEEYIWFKNNLQEIENKCLEIIKSYILEEYNLNYSKEKIIQEISIDEVIFERNEKTIGFVFKWDFDPENGIGIKLTNNNISELEIGFESLVM